MQNLHCMLHPSAIRNNHDELPVEPVTTYSYKKSSKKGATHKQGVLIFFFLGSLYKRGISWLRDQHI